MNEFQYKAFISYRHVSPDKEIATRLHSLIENFNIPAGIRKKLNTKRMGRVFRDEEELPLSTDLGNDIEEALRNSEWLIVVCSAAYLESKWCKAELDYFISLGRRDHILTLLVDGEPDTSFPE
ncbi:MAG: toll/interleukin-1 receptor domain-containing protein, partial [Erysipelotrichaceae bacterium]|nr:toll/interleukin-1 receptor domain-containing protein [Erysipelotrichaceae bacterium]